MQNPIQPFNPFTMTTKTHRLSTLITLYKGLARMYDNGANTKSSRISDYVTEMNLVRVLTSLNIKTILDAGGGNGRWAILLAEHGFDVTLMDISPEILARAEQKITESGQSIKIIEGDIESCPFADHQFDLVMAEGGVISLTPDPPKMLAEFRRITKPGGYVWVDYLNLLGWTLLQPDIDSKIQLAGKEEEEICMGKNEFPFRLFQPRKIRYMLYDAGFLELNEFGNGILTNPMMSDDKIPDAEFNILKKTELELSRNYNLIASAFHVQILAQKIIY